MGDNLLTVTFLVCVIVSPILSYHNFDKYENITMGSSGKKCTRRGRKCLVNAICDEQKSECVCPAGKKGDGTIECVDQNENLCYLSGDPHVHSFGGATVDVNIPCRFRATRFVTKYPTAQTQHASCGVEVFATTELYDGRYVIRSIHCSLGITDNGAQAHHQFEYSKGYDVKDLNIYKYFTNVSSSLSIWGNAHHEQIARINVYPEFDHQDNFAVLRSPECEIRIKFRPYHPGKKYQDQLFGLSIMTPSHAEFVAEFGSYPYSLCGLPNDTERLYEERARTLGFKNAKSAIIYDIAHQKPNQTSNPKAKECKALFEGITSLPKKTAIAILNEGLFILNLAQVGRCLERNKIQPIDVFNDYLSFKSQKGSTKDPCVRLQKAAKLCAKFWIGGTDYKCL